MTGKRLLDAALIIQASRGVASKHVALRKHQLDIYSKTSSIAKAIKSQTDRVTLTVKAASALTERFNEQGPGFSTSASSRETLTKDEPIPTRNEGSRGNVSLKPGELQDQFYERSPDNATVEPPPNNALNVKQEKAQGHPLPDGFVPPQSTNTSISTHDKEVFSELQQAGPIKEPLGDLLGREQGLRPASSGRTSIPEPAGPQATQSADQPKISQGQAEKQIPSLAAEPPPAPAEASKSEGREGTESEDPAISISQEQDIFYTPPTSSGRVLSALPRVKLPRVTEDAQESDEHVPDAQINQDVYYSSTPKDQEHSVAGSQAVPEQEQLPEEAYSEIFHSPRIAKMMRGEPGQESTSKGIQLASVKISPVKKSKTAEEKKQVDSRMGTATQDGSQASGTQSDTPTSLVSEQEAEHDVQSLAADIAKDTEDKTFNAKEVSI